MSGPPVRKLSASKADNCISGRLYARDPKGRGFGLALSVLGSDENLSGPMPMPMARVGRALVPAGRPAARAAVEAECRRLGEAAALGCP